MWKYRYPVAVVTILVTGIITWFVIPELKDPLAPNARPDKILVVKSERALMLLKDRKVLKTYRIALGPNPSGHKVQRGDGRTPEGIYVIDWRNPQSKFHRSLHISYPNAMDRKKARDRGFSPGGDIMIHGVPNGFEWIGSFHRLFDWTSGCIAVSNDEIREIWQAVPDGTPIEIRH